MSKRWLYWSLTSAAFGLGIHALIAFLTAPTTPSAAQLDLAQALSGDANDPTSLNSAFAQMLENRPDLEKKSEPLERFDSELFMQSLGQLDPRSLEIVRDKLRELAGSESGRRARGEIIELLVDKPYDPAIADGIRALIEDEILATRQSDYLVRLQRAYLVTRPSSESAIAATERAAAGLDDTETLRTLRSQFAFHFPDHEHALARTLRGRGIASDDADFQ